MSYSRSLISIAICAAVVSGCGGSGGGSSESDTQQPITIGEGLNDSIIRTLAASTGSCPNGGVQIELGIDANKNGLLDSSEVDADRTQTVCHGTNPALFTIASATEETCAAGGKTLNVGIDANGDNTLQQGEIQQTHSICNGVSAEPVEAPLQALVRTEVEAPGDNCSTGGHVILTGLDNNRNGVLDDAEISNTDYLCNGTDGKDGVDGTDGKDGVDGTDGKDGSDAQLDLLLIKQDFVLDDECDGPALQLSVGLDGNENGQLEDQEIISSHITCAGFGGPLEPDLHGDGDNVSSDYTESMRGFKLIAGAPFDIPVLMESTRDGPEITTAAVTPLAIPEWMTFEQVNPQQWKLSGIAPDEPVAAATLMLRSDVDLFDLSTSFNYYIEHGIRVYTEAVQVSEDENIGMIPVHLSRASDSAIRLEYRYKNALSEMTTSGYLIFAPGETEKTIDIAVFDDFELYLLDRIYFEFLESSQNFSGETLAFNSTAALEIANNEELNLIAGADNHLLFDVDAGISATEGVFNLARCLVPGWDAMHRNYIDRECQVLELVFSGAPEWMPESVSLTPSFDGPRGQGAVIPVDGSLLGESGSFNVSMLLSTGETVTRTVNYNVVDGDRDLDGVGNLQDAFPDNERGATDSDADGIGDEWEIFNFDDLNTADATSDYDNNGQTDLYAFLFNQPVNTETVSFEGQVLPDNWNYSGALSREINDQSSAHGQYALVVGGDATLAGSNQSSSAMLTITGEFDVSMIKVALKSDDIHNGYVDVLVTSAGTGALKSFTIEPGTDWKQYDLVEPLVGDDTITITVTSHNVGEGNFPKLYMDLVSYAKPAPAGL